MASAQRNYFPIFRCGRLLALLLAGVLACCVIAESALDAQDRSGVFDAVPDKDDLSGAGTPIQNGQLHQETEALEDKTAQVPDDYNNSTETTLFDIYLGDKLKGAVLADYTDQWLQISDPKDVVDQLKELNGGERLIPLLTGTINKRREISGVGIVHYNLSTFSIVIDVAEGFLGANKLNLKTE